MSEAQTIGSKLQIFEVCDIVSRLENLLNYDWMPIQRKVGIRPLPTSIIVSLPPVVVRSKPEIYSITSLDVTGTMIERDRTYLRQLALAQPLNEITDPFGSFPGGFVLKPLVDKKTEPIGTEIWCPHRPWKRHGCSTKTRMEGRIQSIRDRHKEGCYLIQQFFRPAYHFDQKCFEWWEAHALLIMNEYHVTAIKWLLSRSIRAKNHPAVTTGMIYSRNSR